MEFSNVDQAGIGALNQAVAGHDSRRKLAVIVSVLKVPGPDPLHEVALKFLPSGKLCGFFMGASCLQPGQLAATIGCEEHPELITGSKSSFRWNGKGYAETLGLPRNWLRSAA